MAQLRRRSDIHARNTGKKSRSRTLGGKRPGAGRWGSGPLQCLTCQHPERPRIDWLLACGASQRSTAEQFGLPRQCLNTHWRMHVSERFKKMAAASHLSSFEEMLTDATEANAETVDTINLLIRGHLTRWGANLEVGADERMNAHSTRVAHLLELRARISLELQPETRNLTVNNYLVRDAASLISVLKDNPAAVAKIEEWYHERMDRKLIGHAQAAD
jgi:hypothetical protein